MKRLLRTWVLFASWSLIVGLMILRAHLRSADNAILIGARYTPLPVAMLPGWGAIFLFSYPAFACTYYLWKRLFKDPLNERLGLIQFFMASLPQVLVPIVAVSILLARGNEATAARAGHFSGDLSADLLSTLKFSGDIVMIFSFASLFVFIYNVTVRLRYRK